MNCRIEQIRTLLSKDPKDVFLRYSLAMEYVSAERFDDAVEAFARCIELDGGYLPAHVELGKALRSAGRQAEARDAFAAALELAANKGETHVHDYVRQQMEGLGGSCSYNAAKDGNTD